MTITKSQIQDALRTVQGPDGHGNIVDLGLLSEIVLKDDRLYLSITVPAQRASELESLRRAAETAAAGIAGVASVTVVLTAEKDPASRGNGAPSSKPSPAASSSRSGTELAKLKGIKHLIAVASGKGGVGKSTTAV